MASFFAAGEVHSNWARARLGEIEVSELRRALTAYVDLGNRGAVPLFQGLTAELEAKGPDAEGALRRIDEALALASETGERACDSLLHRLRGEILLKRDPANTAATEEVFRTAIAIAHAQKARSFELRTALLLAKHHQSTGRFAEAYASSRPLPKAFPQRRKCPRSPRRRRCLRHSALWARRYVSKRLRIPAQIPPRESFERDSRSGSN